MTRPLTNTMIHRGWGLGEGALLPTATYSIIPNHTDPSRSMRQPRVFDPCVNLELLIHPDPCVNLELLIHPDPCVNFELLIHPEPCIKFELLKLPDLCVNLVLLIHP